MSSWSGGLVKVPVHDISMENWWNLSLRGLPKKLKQKVASLLIYTAWNIWKERNMRVFKGLASLPHRILSIIKEEIRLRYLACGGDEPLLLT